MLRDHWMKKKKKKNKLPLPSKENGSSNCHQSMFTPVYYFTNKTCPCSSSITSLFLSSLFSLLKTHLFDTDNTDLTCLTSTHQYCVASFKISHIKKIIKIINTFPMTKSEGGWGSHCNHSRLQYVLNASVC